MCFHFESAKMVVAGDTLFRGGIGRTDLWGGDGEAIQRSITDRLYALDEATRVITGHGPETTIGFELRHNPFVHG
jgi:glyoxylase-like metal-dependent hydrolase (beta-lactamase superfamily II)